MLIQSNNQENLELYAYSFECVSADDENLIILCTVYFHFLLISVLQVNSLIKEFKREHITAWGNHSSEVVEKLYKTVSANLAFIFYKILH